MLQTCELFGGSLLKPVEPSGWSFEKLQEAYRTTDRIQFGVRKEEPLRAQAAQFRQFLAGGDAGELCTGSDALAAASSPSAPSRSSNGAHDRRPHHRAPSAAALDDEWV